MKIRNGFVSNSSSSSFCIMGILMFNKELKETFGECSFYNLKKKNPELSFWNQDDYCLYYIGLDIHKMRDFETKINFKSRALKELNKLLPEGKDPFIEEDIRFVTDGWYNG